MPQLVNTWHLHTWRVSYCHQTDEVPRPPSAIHFEEDYWQNRTAPVPLTFRWPNPWIFEQFESPSLETALVFDEWKNLVAPVHVYPVPQVFSQDDVFVAPASTLHLAELYWLNPVAPVFSGPVPKVFSDDDVIEIQPTCLGEDYFRSYIVTSIWTYAPTAFTVDDVIIPTPPIRDEDFWVSPVAPIQATNFVALPYLPDPEELPAASLIGLVPDGVQGSGMIEGIFGSGVATVPRVSGSGQIRGVTGGGKID